MLTFVVQYTYCSVCFKAIRRLVVGSPYSCENFALPLFRFLHLIDQKPSVVQVFDGNSNVERKKLNRED